MTAQPTLIQPVAAVVTLLDMRSAASRAGIHPDQAVSNVDEGIWPWAFDLSAGQGAKRAVHVWRECLDHPLRAKELGQIAARHDAVTEALAAEAAVFSEIIGTETGDVRGAFLEIRWGGLDAKVIRRLISTFQLSGAIRERTLWVHRTSLCHFLRRRRVH